MQSSGKTAGRDPRLRTTDSQNFRQTRLGPLGIGTWDRPRREYLDGPRLLGSFRHPPPPSPCQACRCFLTYTVRMSVEIPKTGQSSHKTPKPVHFYAVLRHGLGESPVATIRPRPVARNKKPLLLQMFIRNDGAVLDSTRPGSDHALPL